MWSWREKYLYRQTYIYSFLGNLHLLILIAFVGWDVGIVVITKLRERVALTKLGEQSGEELWSSNSNLLYTCRRRWIFLDFLESGKPSRKIRKSLRKIRKPLRKAEMEGRCGKQKAVGKSRKAVKEIWKAFEETRKAVDENRFTSEENQISSKENWILG